jgi:predicted dehydrogenase
MKKIGLVGCGGRIRGVTRRVLEYNSKDISVEAVYDISERSISDTLGLFPGARVCKTYDEMLADPEIDWIFIGSFNAAHREHAIPALKSGKNVFCEKPLATTLDDCLAIAEAAKDSPSKFIVGFVLRYSPFYKKVKELLDADKVGDILSFEFNETLHPNHGAAMHGNWRRHSSAGGTFLMEKCCHDIDLMLWLTGSRPARVASFGGLNFFKPENADYLKLREPNEDGIPYYLHGLKTGHYVGKEDNICPFNDDKDVIDNQVAILELANSVRAAFHLCTHAAIQERRFYICGTKGAIRANVLTGLIEYCPTGWNAEIETFTPIAGDGHGGADELMSAEIAECIINGTEMSTPLEAGLMSSFTCLGIDQAREEGIIVDMNNYWKYLNN